MPVIIASNQAPRCTCGASPRERREQLHGAWGSLDDRCVPTPGPLHSCTMEGTGGRGDAHAEAVLDILKGGPAVYGALLLAFIGDADCLVELALLSLLHAEARGALTCERSGSGASLASLRRLRRRSCRPGSISCARCTCRVGGEEREAVHLSIRTEQALYLVEVLGRTGHRCGMGPARLPLTKSTTSLMACCAGATRQTCWADLRHARNFPGERRLGGPETLESLLAAHTTCMGSYMHPAKVGVHALPRTA